MFEALDYNAGDVLWLGEWSLGWVAFVAVLGVLILGLSAYDLRPLPPIRRWTLLGLRTTAFGLAVLMLLEPAIDLKNVTKVKNHVPILIDTSSSMQLTADGSATTRQQLALDAVTALNLPKTLEDENHVFHVLTYGTSLEEIRPEGLPQTTFNTPASDLTAALAAVENKFDGRELGGLVVISDGIDTGGMGSRTRRNEPLDDGSLALLKALQAPINVVTTGDPTNLKDLAIKRVKHDDFAFVRNKVAVDVEVQVIGFDPQIIQVSLERDGRVVQTRDFTIEPDKTRYDLTFEFVPQQLGREVYTVRAPKFDGEVLSTNNEFHFVQKVIRDKIRVLQVVGRPSWDVRFLRQLLKRNPNIDLISFFILRTNENLITAPNHQLSLIPFPTDELFSQELGSFDLIVFQNFNFGPYAMRQYLPDIANFVRQGGGFAMVGGELSFADGGYADTPIEDILPVGLPVSKSRTVDLSEFRPVLTEAGTRHPITQLAFDPTSNAALWADLPAQHGTNLVLEAKPWATVLANHPRLTAGGKPMPVVTVGEVDEGRVMALTTDNSWRWSFERAGDGATAREYQMFWNNTMRWLIKDPELKLLRVEIEQDIVPPGQPASITVTLQNPDYTPSPDTRGALMVSHRPLSQLNAQPGEAQRLEFVTDARGVAKIPVPAPVEGVYQVVAEVTRNATTLTDRDLFLSVDRTLEHADILPRPDLMGAIASQTAGSTSVSALNLLEPQAVQVNRRKVIQLWDSVLVFLLILGVLTTEWTLRRRFGRL